MSHAATDLPADLRTDLPASRSPAAAPPARDRPAPGWWILPLAVTGALVWGWLFSRLL